MGTIGIEPDLLGRTKKRTDASGDTLYTWDTEWLGALESASTPQGVITSYDEDAFGRIERETTTVTSKSGVDAYVFEYAFGPGGRLASTTYPTPDGEPAFVASNFYDEAGYLRWVRDTLTGDVYWFLRSGNQSAMPEHETYGNGVSTVRGYDPARLWVETIDTTAGATRMVAAYVVGRAAAAIRSR